MGGKQVPPFSVRVDLKVIPVKRYIRLKKVPVLEPHEQLQFYVIPIAALYEK